MDRTLLVGCAAALVALATEVALVPLTPGLGFLGAALAALGAAVMLISLMLTKPDAVDAGLGIVALGVVTAVLGAGPSMAVSFVYQLVPVALLAVAWRSAQKISARRDQTWADEFLAREAARDTRRP